LRRRELHLVIGGFNDALPWAQEIAFTRPYLQTPDGKAHVLAAPPGENSWLMHVEQQLESHKNDVPALLAQVAW
jgi:hypothetical protein